MKLNTSALRIALLCGSLLLSLSAPSAQKHRSSKPQPPSLQGSYTLDDPAAATKTVNEAIEATVKGMWRVLRRTARGKLKKANLPPPQQIIISYTPTDVIIKTEAGTIQTPGDGTFVDRTIRGDKLKVSTKWDDEKLERTFKGGEGQRVNTYNLSGDGKTLTMRVIVNSSRLPQPLTYELNYRRT